MCQFIICNKLITHIFLIILLIINFYYSIEVFFKKNYFFKTPIFQIYVHVLRGIKPFLFLFVFT